MSNPQHPSVFIWGFEVIQLSFDYGPWRVASGVYVFFAVASFYPVLRAILAKVDLHAGGDAFEKSKYFDSSNKNLLGAHYSRIHGTLIFWKNQALKFKRFHYYVMCWTIPSSVLIPVVTQWMKEEDGSKTFLTIVSLFTAILMSFHRGLKIEDNYKSYRHGESEFYDTYRRLLDRPGSFGVNQKDQMENYFIQVETIRRYVRNAETDNLATIDEGKKKYESFQSGNSELSSGDNKISAVIESSSQSSDKAE